MQLFERAWEIYELFYATREKQGSWETPMQILKQTRKWCRYQGEDIVCQNTRSTFVQTVDIRTLFITELV